MAANAIGSGSIILTANADQMAAGLDKAATKVDAFGTRAQSVANTRLGSIGAEGANKIAEASRAFITASLTAMATGVVTAVAHAVAKVEELNTALERTKTLSEQTTDALTRTLTRSLTGPDAAGKRSAILRDFRVAEKDRLALEKQLQAARARAEGEGLSSFFGAGTLRAVKEIPILGIGAKAQFEEAKAQLADLEAKHKAATEAAKQLRAALKTTSEIQEFTKSIREQAATVGLSAEQIKIRELEMKGATDAELKAARAEADWLEKTRQVYERDKAVKDLTKSLREQAETFGMMAEEAAIFRAEQQGAPESILDAAKSALLFVRAKQVEKDVAAALAGGPAFDFSGPKLGGALTKGSAEAFRAVVRHQMAGIAESSDTGKSILGAQKEGNRIGREIVDAVKGITLEAI